MTSLRNKFHIIKERTRMSINKQITGDVPSVIHSIFFGVRLYNPWGQIRELTIQAIKE